jgi:hypothetical protein
MLRDTNFEHSSEAQNFSILDQVEGMRDEHVSEAPDRSADKGVDQAPDGLNDLVLNFRTELGDADLSNQEDIDKLNAMIEKVKAIDESQAETLKQEFMDRKIE